jgi:hypothetical protein
VIGTALRDTAKSWLRSLGYQPAWLLDDYRLISGDHSHTIDCVAFGSDTHDLASSCIAVELRSLNGRIPPNHSMLRLLAPPVVWEVDSRRLRVWKMRPDDLEFIRDVSHSQVPGYLARERHNLSPREVLVAKTTGSLQLDFVDAGLLDAARGATAKVLYDEFHRTVSFARSEYNREISNGELRRLMVGTLQVMTARAFEDKLGWSVDRRGRDVVALLHRVNRHAHGMLPTRAAKQLPDSVAEVILKLLTTRVSFQCATPDVLSMVYLEPALEADERRALGAYYTPQSVGKYIFSVLPVGEIPAAEWFVLDPTCGSGNLLIAAYHALSQQLGTISQSEQDAMLHGRGHGIDNDDIACQSTRAAMLLCSVPRISGWRVSRGDFFRTSMNRLRMPRRPTFIVANPPFGEDNHVQERAAIALRRSLDWLADGGLIGFVVPETFARKSSCHEARADLLANCEVLDVLRLPRDVFPKSRAATQVICARKRREPGPQYAWVRNVRIADRDEFLRKGPATTSRAFRYPVDAWRASPAKEMTNSHLFEIWEEVRRLQLPPLGDAFEIARGFEFLPDAKSQYMTDRPTPGSTPCICSAARVRQFRLAGPEEHVIFDKAARSEAQLRDMNREKAVFCSTSTASIPWRIWAAHDQGGRLVSGAFCYGMAEGHLSAWLLVALLNSKAVNAWFYSFNPTRRVMVSAIRAVPWPTLPAQSARRLCVLARLLQQLPDCERGRLRRSALIAELDDRIYHAFRIGPTGRQLIEELFFGEDRPGFGVEEPPGAYVGRIVDAPGDPRPAGLYKVIGRVAYVDRAAQVVYCDLDAVAGELLVKFPLTAFPPELATAGLSFEALARPRRGTQVQIAEPRATEFQGVTYGEAYEMLERVRAY